MNITFRNVEFDDNDFITELINSNLKEVIDRSFNGYMNYGLFLERIRKEGMSSVIICDNNPCGLLWCTIREYNLHVNAIVIDQEYQGRGIGSFIFDGLEMLAKRMGLMQLELGVQGVNKRARDFYRNRGFVEYGYVKDVDTYYLHKRIY
jgi:GNAT superfamily N-acetyltransferase